MDDDLSYRPNSILLSFSQGENIKYSIYFWFEIRSYVNVALSPMRFGKKVRESWKLFNFYWFWTNLRPFLDNFHTLCMRVCDCSRVSNNRTAPIKRTYWKTRFHMACKEGQLDVVDLMLNDQYQFECSRCEWNDSFWFNRTCTVIRYSRVCVFCHF